MIYENRPTKKGVILAGGLGSRLYPLTLLSNKQMLPVYDKPMIYYAIAIQMLAGVRQIAIVSDPLNIIRFEKLLGDGSFLGLEFNYIEQHQPQGLAHGLKLSLEFISDSDVFFTLGDNFLYGPSLTKKLNQSLSSGTSSIFAYRVKDPLNFGVIEIDDSGKPLKIIEKPLETKSDLISIGLYFYKNKDLKHLNDLVPSKRNELEITDFNNKILTTSQLEVITMDRGFSWFDCGSHEALLRASNFVRTTQEVQGYQIACLEEIALKRNFISLDQYKKTIAYNSSGAYAAYVRSIAK